MPDRKADLGFGAAGIGNLYREVSDAAATAALDEAVRLQYGWIDTAPFYGHGLSERRIGAWLAARADCPMSLSTKVGRKLVPATGTPVPELGFANPDPWIPVFDYSREAVLATFEASCARLGVERIDTVLVHDLGHLVHRDRAGAMLGEALAGAFPALEELRQAGRINRIGLGVNEVEACVDVLAQRPLDVVLLAGRYTLLEHEASLGFLNGCAQSGTRVILGGVFNSGLLAGSSEYNYQQAPEEVILRATAIEQICASIGVPLGAASLQFAAHHPAVETVLVGARTAKEVEQCAAWFNADIPPAMWKALRDAGLLSPEAPIAQ